MLRYFLNNGVRAFRISAGMTNFFLDAVGFAFKPCGLAFSLKSEQLEAIYDVVTGKDVFVKDATGFGKSLCVFLPFRCVRLPLQE